MIRASKRRMAENEVIFRKANESISDLIEEAAQNSEQPLIRFYCECSREECRERILLTPADYKKLHQSNRQFIVLNGHEIPEIEKVVSRENGFNLIEKYVEPPTQEELNLAIKKIRL